MINHWLKEESNYWSYNIDSWYPPPDINNEDLGLYCNANTKEGELNYLTEFIPVKEWTMYGIVYHDGQIIQIFGVDNSGEFILSDMHPLDFRISEGFLNHTTGEIKVKWNGSDFPKIVVSYTYRRGL